MTQAQHDALAAELAELEGPKRAEMVQAIATARSFGDLSENFEYHAAKNEQGLLERRITILRSRLENATVVEHAQEGVVGVGSVVEVEDEAGGRFEVEISSVGGVSTESPLGSALLGAKIGDSVQV
jgi:transcription elongation factor GreA